MAAYVISEVEVIDEAAAARYREMAARSIERYGGRFVVRDAVPEALEGDWSPERRLVVVEFPTLEEAHRWYTSPDYAEALNMRAYALRRRLLIADGLAGAGS